MQALSTDQLVGQKVGSYHVARLLGQGRLSAVYLAQHTSQNINVALTTYLLPEHLSAEARHHFMQRFMKEAAILVSLEHPHILPVYEYGEQFGYPYLVTPYMMNGSLADVLKQQGRCTPEYVQGVLEQVVAGLDYAYHKGVIHGTLKPANILLSQEGTMLVAGIGLQHMLQAGGVNSTNQPNAHLLSIAETFLCPPEYLAPEVAQGQPIDRRSDIYALGCILFELLSGKPPFTGPTAMDTAMMHVNMTIPSLYTLCPDIPIALASIVNQALARTPAQRFQRAEDLAEAFTQVCEGTLHSSRRAVGQDVTSMMEGPDTGGFLLDNGGSQTGSWQLMPPVVTGKTLAIRESFKNLAQGSNTQQSGITGGWQLLPPIVTGQLPAIASTPDASRKATKPAPDAPRKAAKPVQSTPEFERPRTTAKPTPPSSFEALTMPGVPPADFEAPVSSVAPSASVPVQPTQPAADSYSLVRSLPTASSEVTGFQAIAPVAPQPPVAAQAPMVLPGTQGSSAQPQQSQEWWSRNDAAVAGFGAPPTTGFSAPPTTGFSAPPTTGFSAPPTAGFGAPPVSRPLDESNMSFNRIRLANTKQARPGRRKVVAALVGGGVLAAGIGVAAKLNLFHTMAGGAVATTAQNAGAGTTNPQVQQGAGTTQGNGTGTTQGNGAGTTQGNGTGTTQGNGTGTTQGNGGTQGQKPAPQPTQAAAAHTGTVVGSTAQAMNSAKVFTNPKDNNGSLLIRMPKGTFSAFESACTHEGVTVNYDPNTMTLACPAHGAIFDAATGQVIQGPAKKPLPAVTIKVNTDGTITV